MAFIRTILAFLLSAGLLIPGGHLFAAHISVTLDTALTNGTDWAYGPGVAIKKDGGHPYIRAQDGGFITSPTFDLAITSITVVAWNASEKTKREAEIVPETSVGFGTTPPRPHALTLSTLPQSYSFFWPRESLVQSFTIQSIEKTGSSGSINFSTIEIDGHPLTPMPTALTTASIRRDSFVAKWENGPTVQSNLIHLLKKEVKTFDSVQATSSTAGISPDLLGPGFGGESLCSVSNGNGIVQIGTGKRQGFLSYSGVSSYAGRHLVCTAQRHPYQDEGKVMQIQWVLNGSTNDIARVTLDDSPVEYRVDLSSVPDNAALLLHSTRKTNGRILLSSFGFANTIATHLVRSEGGKRACQFRVSGLLPRTDYLWMVTAFSADAMASAPSAYQAVRTTDRPPPALVIRFR